MLGNLHVRFGVGAGVKLPGLHHAKGANRTPFYVIGNRKSKNCDGGTPSSGNPMPLAVTMQKSLMGDLHVTTRQMVLLRLVAVADDHVTVRIPGRACPAIP
jgi:hypothetical protein